jgi:hypothetical protein
LTHSSIFVTLDIFLLASGTEATLINEVRQIYVHLFLDKLHGLLKGVLRLSGDLQVQRRLLRSVSRC